MTALSRPNSRLILRTGDQRSHVEREYLFAAQAFGYVAVHDTAGDASRDGCLAPRPPRRRGWGLLSSCAKVEYALSLVASDDGVEFSGACHLVQVDGIFLPNASNTCSEVWLSIEPPLRSPLSPQ